MKRAALIFTALFVVLAGAGAALAFYWKPSFLFASSAAEVAAPQHGLPDYSAKANDQLKVRRTALGLVERLGAVQDRIIRGDRSALPEQAELLSAIAREVRHFSDEDWTDYVNLRTSLLYVLSGGDARVLRPVTKSETLAPSDQKLSLGIMSFADGESKKARELFEGIDPRSLDISLVGPFALARASLYFEDDHAKAIELLDDARLAGPHTAIDEAAARREIPLLISLGNVDRAMMLTTSYVREFGKSIYAWKLYREFARAAAQRPELDSVTTVDRIAAALDEKDIEQAPELFLNLAGEAILQGRLKLAKAASNRFIAIDDISPENRDRARLYLAAAEAPSDNASDALRALNQIAAERLSDDDSEIREIAGFIAKTVVGSGSAPGTAVASGNGASSPEVAKEPTAMKASAAMSEADSILKKADTLISRSVR